METGKQFIIRGNSLDPKRGNILISEPLMRDFHFGRSVVLLVDHEESEGSFGVIVNKRLNVNVNHIVDEFPDFEAPVYLGGPVADGQLFFVHTLGDMIPDSSLITDSLYWGGDVDVLKTLVSTGIANESNTRFFLGYSGWDSGQLVGELVRNSWLVSNITTSLLFGTPTDRMWQAFVNQLGGRYKMWSRFPKNFEDN